MTATARLPALPRDQALDISKAEPYRRRFADLKRKGEHIRRIWRDIDEAEARDRSWWLYGEDKESIERMENYAAPIINNTILDVARTLAGGIYSGLTPPSKEWFRIRPASNYLEDDHEAEDHLNRLTAKCRHVIALTMFYAEVYAVYWDASFFGIGAFLMEDDVRRVLSFQRLPPGSYWPATDAGGRIVTLYRRYALTLAQMAEEFGVDNLAPRQRDALERGNLDETATIIQAIEPVRDDDRTAPEWAGYESVYILDDGQSQDPDHILKRAYYRVKPFAVFRWTSDGVSPYPKRWPGFDALGDAKQLNLLESDKLMGIEIMVKPPLAADAKLRGKIPGGYPMPGKMVWTDGAPGEAIVPILRAQINLADLRNEIATSELRIQRAFYNHYFMAMLGEHKDMTAVEANYRAEEKTAIIGATVEQFSGEFLPDVLTCVVDRVYHHGLAPTPPESLRNMETRFEYIGNLTISVQVLESAKVDSLLMAVAELAKAGQTQGWDNIDVDEAINVKAKALGVNPDVVRAFDMVKALRAERQQAMAQQQQAAALQQGSEMVRNLGGARMGGGTALDALAGGGEGLGQE